MSLLISAVDSAHIEYTPSSISDELLVCMAKAGDPSAFVELSKRHANKICQATYRVTRNWPDAEDALQDSLLKAFLNMKNFEERSTFSTWLTRIAINSALMILRKKRNSCEISMDGPESDARNLKRWEPVSPTEDPENGFVRREREKILRKAMHELPPVFRDVIHLRHAGEYSVKEIAQSLGITVSAVKSRLARARGALRTSLLEAELQPPV